MIDQRLLIERLERANTSEFARLMAGPTLGEEEALRAHLGESAYQRLHAAALRVLSPGTEHEVSIDAEDRGSLPRRPGNVVLLPGLMGSELTAFQTGDGPGVRVWLNPPALAMGLIERLSLTPGCGGDGSIVRASGIIKAYYGETLLGLARRWNAQAFWYDWRRGVEDAADDLRLQADRWFGPDAPVHLVAHGMGGLVARAFVLRHADRWKTMWDSERRGERGGRLVMLGTPNHGSYQTLQVAAGLAPVVRKLALVDRRHNLAGILRVLHTFPGLYQMLPSPSSGAGAGAFYDARTYGDLNIPQSMLDQARRFHDFLRGAVDKARMVYIAGSNRPTPAGLADPARLRETDAYLGTTAGDGWVSHSLGVLKGVCTYYVDEESSSLPSNPKVLAALDGLLRRGKTDALDGGQVARGTPREGVKTSAWDQLGRSLSKRESADLSEMSELSRQLLRSIAPGPNGGEPGRGGGVSGPPRVGLSEREVRDLLTRGVVGPRGDGVAPDSEPVRPLPRLRIALVPGQIQEVDQIPPAPDADGGPPRPVDALSVGHYVGVRPQAAELALDKAVSRAVAAEPGVENLATSDLILTQYTDRGLLRGDLGTTFFLPFPGAGDRVLAVAGMGPVGGCGAPEIAVLVRELGWALGKYGKTHLATVLIGSGNGNLSTRQCVEAWFRGLKRAIDEPRAQPGAASRRLQCVTFVEFDGLKVAAIQAAIQDAIRLNAGEISVEFEPLTPAQLRDLERRGLEVQAENLARDLQKRRDALESGRDALDRASGPDLQPTRLSAGMAVDPSNPGRVRYTFGALTESASIPEREIVLNRLIVERANDELAGETDPVGQRERGQFLGRLLIPQELSIHLSSTAPLVLQVDATTARVHWEMIAQPDPILPEEDKNSSVEMSSFLGTYRGLTRQLRTSFARPPEPARNLQPIPRVLVIADPSLEAPLAGAQEEGLAVASLFQTYNTLAERAGLTQRFDVTRLIGPLEATPTRVLRELAVRRYHVLHYAGHCFFDAKDPSQSGWRFSEGVVISAYELQRIDRIPTLVVSNACESGITPDRTSERSAALVPSFAEAFFAKGVANFVGTAWPVNDLAARRFATTLYATLLGLQGGPGDDPWEDEAWKLGPLPPLPMHTAMLRARLDVARTRNGRGTWGAYQHYGNPFYRLLAPSET